VIPVDFESRLSSGVFISRIFKQADQLLRILLIYYEMAEIVFFPQELSFENNFWTSKGMH
jgi:hypothetical protein